MARRDAFADFCDTTAIGTSTGRLLVGDVIDLQRAGHDLGTGKPIYCVITVTTAATSTGSATVSFELASDAQAAIATDASASVHIVTPAVAVASLVAGYRFVIPIPSNGSVPYERYLGILTNIGTAALNAGKITAFLTPAPDLNRATPAS